MYNGLHYNSISTWLKDRFGCRVVKLALDGGFTCPNRDGSKGYGGCTFCSRDGSGSFAGSIAEQLSSVSKKWTRDQEEVKYIAYFQNHTNTYAPVSELREKYYKVLEDPRIKGLVIGTRPDCLGEDVLDLLSEINKNHFLWVELGLQTIHEETAKNINRCYSLSVFDKAMEEYLQENSQYISDEKAEKPTFFRNSSVPLENGAGENKNTNQKMNALFRSVRK